MSQEMKGIKTAFICLSAVLLLAAAGKLHLAAAAFHRLDGPEQITSLTIRQFLIISGAVELVLATLLVCPINARLKLHLAGSLASGILAFRAVKAMIGDGSSCHCMGSVSELIGISDGIIQWLSYGLAFGILGFWLWMQIAEMKAARRRSTCD